MTKQLPATAVEGILAYLRQDREILWLALQAAGSGVGDSDGNKTLAMIGNVVMKFVLFLDLTAADVSRG
jgi:hypothetical protein